ncbi:hypothetical protein CH289_08505 [Rhodococcus sp. RS1C4]|nr:hypothetical protein CH289_08505 [Rhodococcus sp. RS1C4]
MDCADVACDAGLMRTGRIAGRVVLVGAVAAGLATGITPPVAQACTCAYGLSQVSDRVRQHSSPDGAVFVGVATDVRDDGSTLTYDVRVSEIYDGDVEADAVVSTAAESAACGSTLAVGDEYIFFAQRGESSRDRLQVNSCSATAPTTDRTTLDAAERSYGTPTVLEADSPPIGATLWLGVAGVVSVAVAFGGVLLLGRRRS